MVLFLEVDPYFRDCVKREREKGASRAEAEKLCWGWGWRWPAGFYHSVSPPTPPAVQPPPPSPPPGDGAGNGSGGADGSGGTGDAGNGSDDAGGAAGAVGGAAKEQRRKTKNEQFGLTRWGPESLGITAQVPMRNARTDAHVWANEQVATGHRPPFNREEWRVSAGRLGLTPDQEAEGWHYIERVWSKRWQERRDNVVAELGEAVGNLLEFSGQPYGGYSLPMPHELKVKVPQMRDEPSWPWRTKSAARLWDAIQAIHRLYPEMMPDDILDRAYQKAKVSTYELTPEDDAILGIAFYWLLSRLDPDIPTPPPVATQTTAYGMKGTQATAGKFTMPRGAP